MSSCLDASPDEIITKKSSQLEIKHNYCTRTVFSMLIFTYYNILTSKYKKKISLKDFFTDP